MTVAYYDAVSPSPATSEWFHHVGTTAPTVIRETRKFMARAFMTGCVATSTLPAVAPEDAVAFNNTMVRSGTLPALLATHTRPTFDQSVVPSLLQRLRHLSGLSWGELGRAVGVSRRTIHNWLNGDRVADVHLTRLLEMSRVVDRVATGSVDATRAALLQRSANGRSIIDDLALAARPTRRRPLSSVSVGDLVTPLDETAGVSPEGPQRRSSLQGASLPRRRPNES